MGSLLMETPALSALLFCTNVQATRVLYDILQMRRISRLVCPTGSMAIQSLARRKFDLLIVDLDYSGTQWLLEARESNTDFQETVVIAIAEEDKTFQSLSIADLKFTLQKPLVAEAALKVVDAACETAVREKTPAFRFWIDVPITAV